MEDPALSAVKSTVVDELHEDRESPPGHSLHGEVQKMHSPESLSHGSPAIERNSGQVGINSKRIYDS